MSEVSSQNATSETEHKPSDNEEKLKTNKNPGVKNSNKTHAILPIIKNNKNHEESTIDINDITNKDAKNQCTKVSDEEIPGDKIDGTNGYLANRQYQTQIRPPKKLWVMEFEGTVLPSGGSPLVYTPASCNDLVRLFFGFDLIMNVFTLTLCFLSMQFLPLKMFLEKSGYISFIAAMILLIGLVYSMASFSWPRLYPYNFISLVLAEVFMTTIYVSIISYWKGGYMIMSLFAMITVLIVGIIVSCTNFNFNSYYFYVFVLGTAVVAASLLSLIYYKFQTGTYFFSYVVSIHLSVYFPAICLVVELHMILKGVDVEMDEEDVALGIFLLYTSVIDVFVKTCRSVED